MPTDSRTMPTPHNPIGLTRSNTWKTLLGSALIGTLGWGAISTAALAERGECTPPQPGEYLILVINPEEDEQEAVAALIPPERDATICNYLGEIVTRVGGYREQQDANVLAQTIAAETGLGAFVTRPPQVEAVEAVEASEEAPSVTPSESTSVPVPSPRVPPSVEIAPNPPNPTSLPSSTGGIPLIPGRAIELEPNSARSDRETSDRNTPDPQTVSTPPAAIAPPVLTSTPTAATASTEPTTLPSLDLSSAAISLEESSTPDSPAYNPPPQVSASSPENDREPIPDLEVRSRPPMRESGSRELPEVPPSQAQLPPDRNPSPPEPISATSSVPPFNPQPLDAGYAILVDYAERPELAAQIQQVVGQNVGLVSYGQRPYMLVMHTQDERSANSTLQTLSSNGFLAMMVDSRQVILLAPKVEQF